MRPTTNRPSKCRVLAFSVLVFLLLATAAVVFHRPILRATAQAWIADDAPVETFDAVIIPGGGLATRPFGAADFYHRGFALRLVAFDVQRSPAQEIGAIPPEHEITLEILDSLGVPAETIEIIGREVASTWDEVEATREWCLEHEVSSLAVVTEIFPSRRVRWAYEKGLRDLEIEIHIVPLESERYSAKDWWRDEEGLIQFQNELIKYLYYRLRY